MRKPCVRKPCVRKLLEATQRLKTALLLKQPGLAGGFCVNLQNCVFTPPYPPQKPTCLEITGQAGSQLTD
jgi:hypothetical protein